MQIFFKFGFVDDKSQENVLYQVNEPIDPKKFFTFISALIGHLGGMI